MGPPSPPLHLGAQLPPHLLNRWNGCRSPAWGLFGDSSQASIPCGTSAWPFRACSLLRSKTTRWPNLFPILWKELCNQMCLPAQLKGRAEAAPPPPFPREVELCPPLPQWALGPPRACAEGTHGCVPRAACLSWWSQAATTRGRTSLWCCSLSSTTPGSPSCRYVPALPHGVPVGKRKFKAEMPHASTRENKVGKTQAALQVQVW